MEAELIIGGVHIDHRGILTFFNEFDMSSIKRFYIVEHLERSVIRAWQGHKNEQKWFYVTEGAFQVILVEPDSWITPSPNLTYTEFILKASNTEILHIPAGIATGFRALEVSAKMMIFSNVTLNESLNDDYRFDQGLWYNWNNI